ncbi:tripartite tricarboxylate transporter TctB [Rhodopseudomonas palustris]|uniref:Tripartite tricarboxylate transporter TctB n=1 Tax=Rhodopseudomonas palustris TaxID=1076 RepID=A0A0D7EWQ3_RHOPL|nr:tripartite tricarboxylate transporter TctB [Rhodopseudomonas palustris]
MNKNVVRGYVLAFVALGFGLGSFRYSIGSLDNTGPGLFPLLVSSMLLAIAILIVIRARYEAPDRLEIKVRSIASVLAGLVGFVLVSKIVGMIVGIVVLVFVAALAGSSYSWRSNLKISAALIVVAFAFQGLLGLHLGLY